MSTFKDYSQRKFLVDSGIAEKLYLIVWQEFMSRSIRIDQCDFWLETEGRAKLIAIKSPGLFGKGYVVHAFECNIDSLGHVIVGDDYLALDINISKQVWEMF